MALCTQTLSNASKLVFTFEFTRSNFSKLDVEKFHHSPKYTAGNIEWYLSLAIKVEEKKPFNESHLNVFLHLEGNKISKLWCCYARVCLTIVSQKKGVENFSLDFKHLFSSAVDNCGFKNFMEWNKLLEPENGFIKNDTVTFRVHIVADPPQNVDPNSEKEIKKPQKFDEWLSLFESEINEKIVFRITEEFKNVTCMMEEVSSAIEEIKKRLLDNSSVLGEVNNALLKSALVDDEIKNALLKLSSVLRKIKNAALKKDEEIVSFVIDNDDDVKNVLLENSSTGEVKRTLLTHSSVLNEVENAISEKYENKNNAGVDEMKKNFENGSNTLKPDIFNADSVMKILNDFKNDMKTEFFSLLFSQCSDGWNPSIYSASPRYQSDNHFFSHRQGGSKTEFSFGDCESAHFDEFGYSMPKKCGRKRKKSINSCSSTARRHFCKTEAFLENCDENESDSSDTSVCVGEPCQERRPHIPSETEALRRNLNLNKPWKKELLLLGKDGNDKLETHKATCLKELYDLQKKYPNYDVLEAEIAKMV